MIEHIDFHQKAYVCIHVFRHERPVLFVSRADGDWCLLCGDEHEDDASAYRVVGIGHILARDPTINALLDLPPEWEAERSAEGENWHRQPITDDETAHPVAHAWRATLREIVNAFAAGDYTLARGVRFVAPISTATANQIENYLAHYGEKLAELPDETWSTSVSQWMGTHWDVLVDLWTVEAGESDLVLSARVFEVEDGFRIEIDSIHVP